ncbi:Mss4p nuclear export [Geranomyces variabilis]|uniref:Mss4p nuclear export n=1 Tax=Geranomyces variabilis TaxID=109894 RepID=A0AAD5XMT1_9FUNG|nr:Mss4p nuclear export [Geranomyces variabilis]
MPKRTSPPPPPQAAAVARNNNKRKTEDEDGDDEQDSLANSGSEKALNDGTDNEKADGTDDDDDDEDDDEDLDKETVDVDFEFFDPKEIDFHGLKSLLRQTFANDADLIPTSVLADLIISQPAVGTTVKTEENPDPYAVMTALSFATHANHEGIAAVRAYILDSARKAIGGGSVGDSASSIAEKVQGVLDGGKAAWVVNERLINMPPQVVPPMMNMLLEEIEWAVEDGEPFEFDYFVYISKIYREIESVVEEDGEEAPPTTASSTTGKSKKKKKKAKLAAAAAAASEAAVFYFQPEDELLAEHAEFMFDFKFQKEAQSTDSRRAFQEFGIDPLRRVFIVRSDKMKVLAKELGTVLGSS